MAKFSELVKGFRANVRDGIPTELFYDGKRIHLTCSPNQNGYVGLASREGKSPCFNTSDCSLCALYREYKCDLDLAKPIKR